MFCSITKDKYKWLKTLCVKLLFIYYPRVKRDQAKLGRSMVHTECGNFSSRWRLVLANWTLSLLEESELDGSPRLSAFEPGVEACQQVQSDQNHKGQEDPENGTTVGTVRAWTQSEIVLSTKVPSTRYRPLQRRVVWPRHQPSLGRSDSASGKMMSTAKKTNTLHATAKTRRRTLTKITNSPPGLISNLPG